jgi:formylglycine-generating enzyme required for sulfatase activity
LNGGNGLNATGGGYESGWAASDNGSISPTNAALVNGCSGDPAYATWTSSVGTQERLPIVCVNWWEAYAFCIWDGAFLPSEAEWEYAAAGGTQQREYPWGATAPGTGNQYAIYNCDYPNGSGTCSNVSNIAPVGTATAGAGLWGQLDLTGNVGEWNLDWYNNYVDPCTDCADLTATSSRTLRGGYWNLGAVNLLPPSRVYYFPPTQRNSNVGFRCARTP